MSNLLNIDSIDLNNTIKQKNFDIFFNYYSKSMSLNPLKLKSKSKFFPIFQNEINAFSSNLFLYEYLANTFYKKQKTCYSNIDLTFYSQTILNNNNYEKVLFDNPELMLKFSYENNMFVSNTYLYDQYSYLRNKSFIKFFIQNLIDVPICFKKSKSLHFLNSELPVLKFINFLLKNGKKEFCTRNVLTAFFNFFNLIKRTTHTEFDLTNKWVFFFRIFYMNILTTLVSSKKSFLPIKIEHFSNDFYTAYSFKNHLSPNLGFWGLETNDFLINNNFRLNSFFISQLIKILPIFTFYIYNVDKNIKKYSRGKSGKYVFIWKYVPPYKRQKTVLKIIAKQIKFYQYKTFYLRLFHNFSYLYKNKSQTFLFKKKNFSYNYVFKHFRHSLMKNYSTTTM